MKFTFKKANSGFTLIELITVMSVAIILAAMVVPSFDTAIRNNKLTSSTSKLMGELEYARSEAIKRNLPVTICGSSDHATCNTSDWEKGRIVFIDDGAGDSSKFGNGIVDGEVILKQFEAISNDITISATAFSNTAFLTYVGDGSVGSSGTMVLCDSRGSSDTTTINAVNISVVGQSRKAYDSDRTGDDVVNDISGSNVSC